MQQKSAVRAVSLRPMHIIGDYRVPGGIATQKEAESHRESRWVLVVGRLKSEAKRRFWLFTQSSVSNQKCNL